MKDFKTVSVRLSKHEAKAIEQFARDKGVTVSELVRLWLEQAAKQAWQQQAKGGLPR
jgi:antitoxin component of RelBE/YafQ-DinJ toxin-antitoxin module